MALASKELKDKINLLVKDIAKDMDIKLGFSIKIADCQKIILNIRSCSIDLASLHKESVESKYNHLIAIKDDGRRFDRFSSLHYDLMENNINFSCDKPEEIFEGKALELLQKIRDAVKCDFYNDSDSTHDYFDIAYYYDIRIGDGKSGFKVV